MEITVKKLTGLDEVREACDATFRGRSGISLERIYKCEHSPIRTQMFWVEMIDIPTFVSVHLVRHKIGVEHFVLSNRDDRGGAGDEEVTRNTPVNHSMLINAQALINMARKRLCFKASEKTREVMEGICFKVFLVDKDLYRFLAPECIYRNGYCPELKICGKMDGVKGRNEFLEDWRERRK